MQLLHGRYEIVEIIKSGGMGSVFEARDNKLADSPCAVKEILEDKQNELYFQTRFEQEMKVLAELDHPAIPRVRDFFRLKGKHYLVMDLVRGQSLFEEVESARRPLTPEQVVKDMLELLDVLDYLHGHNPPIIHRDIKPSNILRDRRSGQIKLVDFGLARSVSGATQTAVGTLGFCAPEQSVGRAEPRSDLYSVGATMIALLTAQDPDMLRPREQLEMIPAGLRQVVQRATRLKVQERYASAKEMATDLRLWQRGLGAAAGRVIEAESSRPEVVYVHSQSSPWRGYATAAAIVLALGLGTLLGRSEAPSPAPPRPVSPQPVVSAAPPEARALPGAVPEVKPVAPPTQTIVEEEIISEPAPAPVAAAPSSPPPVPAEIHPSLGETAYPTYRPSPGRFRPILDRQPFFSKPQFEGQPPPPPGPPVLERVRQRRGFEP
ncbi:MAG: serine/threonine-protein kinase [Vulcanimicrobiota bacterium]